MPATFQSPIRGTTHQAGNPGATFQAPPRGTTHQADAESIEVYAPYNSVEIVTDELQAITGLEAHYDAKYVNGLEVAPAVNESNLATWVDISGGLASKNKASYDTATLENSIGYWIANNDCTIARSQAQYFGGSWSLQMTSTGASNPGVRTGSALNAIAQQPVTGGKAYTLVGWVRAGSVGRVNRLYFAWVDSSGTFITTGGSSNTVTSNTTGWTKIVTTEVAPANAAGFYTYWTVTSTAGAGELHYFDNYGYWEGPSTDWVAPTRPARNLVQATEATKPMYLSGSKNLLTFNQATIETDTTGWYAGALCTVSRSSTQKHSGGYSLLVSPTGTGRVYPITKSGGLSANTGGIPVTVGKTYTATAAMRRVTGSDTDYYLSITWHNSSGGFISESQTSNQTVSDTGWTVFTVTGTAPANATHANVAPAIVSTTAGENYYVDTVGFWEGTSTNWSPPLSTSSVFPAVVCQGVQGMRGWPYSDWDFTSGPTAKFSVYIVARVESPALPSGISNLANTNPWSSNVDGFYIRHAANNSIAAVHASGVTSTNHMSAATNASSAPKEQWGVYSIVVDAAAPIIKAASNGTAASSSVVNTLPGAPPHNQYALGIGNYSPGAATYEQNVFFAEIIAFSDAHSDSVRQSIERSLGSKYGITVA